MDLSQGFTYTRGVRVVARAGVICHLRPRHQANPLKRAMQLNCKMGDLAIVVTTELPENQGQIVEVLGPRTSEPLTLSGSGHVWTVRTMSGRATLHYRFSDTGKIIRLSEGPAPDCCLRPVSGLPIDTASSVEMLPEVRQPASTLAPQLKAEVAQ